MTATQIFTDLGASRMVYCMHAYKGILAQASHRHMTGFKNIAFPLKAQEMMGLGDRIAVMNTRKVRQIGTPQEI